jgi:hypothetical protein
MNVLTVYVDGKTFNMEADERTPLEILAKTLFEEIDKIKILDAKLIDGSRIVLHSEVLKRCIFHARIVSKTAKAMEG